MAKVEGQALDPVLTPDCVDENAPESLAATWLRAMGSDRALPSEAQSHGLKESLILRHLKVDKVEPGRVICSVTVKPPITNRYNTLHGGVVGTIANITALAAVKTLGGDGMFSLTEMGISYMSAARINVELEVEAQVLRFGKSVAVSSVDIRNKETKQIAFQGRATFYNMPVSNL